MGNSNSAVKILSNPGASKQDISMLFQALDKDHSGNLDQEEFLRIAKALYKANLTIPLQEATEQMVDNMKYTSVEKGTPQRQVNSVVDHFGRKAIKKFIQQHPDIEAFSARMFSSIDTNQDGRISLEELEHYLRHQAEQERELAAQKLRQAVANHIDDRAQKFEAEFKDPTKEKIVDIPGVMYQYSYSGKIDSVEFTIPGLSKEHILDPNYQSKH